MSKRLLLSLTACIVFFGAASYLPKATQQTFAPEEVAAPSPAESVPTVLAASSVSSPAPQRDERSITVYITDTGAKYHTSSCQHLRRSKHAISLRDAKAQGYDACKVCKPPR